MLNKKYNVILKKLYNPCLYVNENLFVLLLFEYKRLNIIWINWQLFQSSLKAIVVCVYVWAQPFSLSLFIFCTFVNFHFHKSRSRYRKRDDRGHWAKAMLMKASLIIELSAGVVTIKILRLWKNILNVIKYQIPPFVRKKKII